MMREADERIHSSEHITALPPLANAEQSLRDLADFLRAMEDGAMTATMNQMANKAAQDAKSAAGQQQGEKPGEQNEDGKPQTADAGKKPGEQAGPQPGEQPGSGEKPGDQSGAGSGSGQSQDSAQNKPGEGKPGGDNDAEQKAREQAARNTALANEILKALEEQAAKAGAGQEEGQDESKDDAMNAKDLAGVRERAGVEKLAEDLKQAAAKGQGKDGKGEGSGEGEGNGEGTTPGELSDRLAAMSRELKKEAARLNASRLAKLSAARDQAKALREQAKKEQEAQISPSERALLERLKEQGLKPGTQIRVGNKTLTVPGDKPGEQPGNQPGNSPGGNVADDNTQENSRRSGFGAAVQRFTVEADRLHDEPITGWTKQLETKVPEVVIPALDGIVQRLDVLIAQLPGSQAPQTAHSRVPEASRREVEDYFKNLSDDFGDEAQ
jgi:hypothetical protein